MSQGYLLKFLAEGNGDKTSIFKLAKRLLPRGFGALGGLLIYPETPGLQLGMLFHAIGRLYRVCQRKRIQKKCVS